MKFDLYNYNFHIFHSFPFFLVVPITLHVWNQTTEVILPSGNISLHKIGYSGKEIFLCTQGVGNYNISCTKKDKYNCKVIPEGKPGDKHYGYLNQINNKDTTYYVDIPCVNKTVALKWYVRKIT